MTPDELKIPDDDMQTLISLLNGRPVPEAAQFELVDAYAKLFPGDIPPSLDDVQRLLERDKAIQFFDALRVLREWYREHVRANPAYYVVNAIKEARAQAATPAEDKVLPDDREMRAALDLLQTRLLSPPELGAEFEAMALKLANLSLRDVVHMWLTCHMYGLHPFEAVEAIGRGEVRH